MEEDIDIVGYHAHVYFDASTVQAATALCEAASKRFGIAMGRVHERPVGPHPRWSCQLAFDSERFADVVPWLAMHRGEMDVLVHTRSGDDLRDHTQGAMWLGNSHPLKLEMFTA